MQPTAATYCAAAACAGHIGFCVPSVEAACKRFEELVSTAQRGPAQHSTAWHSNPWQRAAASPAIGLAQESGGCEGGARPLDVAGLCSAPKALQQPEPVGVGARRAWSLSSGPATGR